MEQQRTGIKGRNRGVKKIIIIILLKMKMII